jgi:hypothetical protein
MYFWNTEKLATEIKNGNFTEKDRKNYYLSVSIFSHIALYLSYLAPPQYIEVIIFEMIILIIVLIIGIKVTFKSNNGNEGNDYLGRMTALSFPLFIKLYIIIGIAGFLIDIVIEKIHIDMLEKWFYTLIIIIMTIIYFWRLNVHIKYINTW